MVVAQVLGPNAKDLSKRGAGADSPVPDGRARGESVGAGGRRQQVAKLLIKEPGRGKSMLAVGRLRAHAVCRFCFGWAKRRRRVSRSTTEGRQRECQPPPGSRRGGFGPVMSESYLLLSRAFFLVLQTGQTATRVTCSGKADLKAGRLAGHDVAARRKKSPKDIAKRPSGAAYADFFFLRERQPGAAGEFVVSRLSGADAARGSSFLPLLAARQRLILAFVCRSCGLRQRRAKTGRNATRLSLNNTAAGKLLWPS